MKFIQIIICCIFSNYCHGQKEAAVDSAVQFIQQNKIALNKVIPPPGFSVYYNCDSMLFMRGNFGDTIKIWTPGIEMPQEIENLKGIIEESDFGSTVLAKEVQNDGRVLVIRYWQTQFIYRNDSLFQIENSNELPSSVYTDLYSEYFKDKMDKDVFERKRDSINAIAEAQAVYIPKLIFSKKMFINKNKVHLNRKVNFKEDTIVLEKKWKLHGKNCYLVRINNKEDGQETSYAYAIDDNMRFVWWEGCNN